MAFVWSAANQMRAELPRGGRVGWGRLETSNSIWAIHSDHDAQLAAFIQEQTSLNIDPAWHSVKADEVEQLCTYPLIYAKDLSDLRESELVNLGEYLRRGGFLLIDPCSARVRSMDDYLQRHREIFVRMLPEMEMQKLPEDHPIFGCYFKVTKENLITEDMLRLGAPRPTDSGTYGVYYRGRMVTVLTTVGLECGWPNTPQRIPGCMKMIVNMYVYAMTRPAKVGAETPAAASGR